jgi:hypothetical protein
VSTGQKNQQHRAHVPTSGIPAAPVRERTTGDFHEA